MVVPMDFRKTKVVPSGEEVVRSPLLPSEKNNAAAPSTRKSPAREVTSRYKSGTTPAASAPGRQRFPSPSAPRTAALGNSGPKRAQSAERRRPSTPPSRSSAPSSPSSSRASSNPSSSHSRPSTPVRDSSVATNSSSHRLGGKTSEGLWPSMRSLSSSFQSQFISIPVSKKDRPGTGSYATADDAIKCSGNVPPERKRTPLRGRNTSDQSEKPKSVEKAHSRVTDHHRWPGVAGARSPSTAMTRSVDAASMGLSSRGASPRRTSSSDGNSRALGKSTSDGARRMFLDGIGIGELEIGSSPSVPSNPPEKSTLLTRPTRTLSLPFTGVSRPSSPNKSTSPSASSSRSSSSPSRTRPTTPFTSSSTPGGRTGISSSVLSYIVDVRKGKKNANHMEYAHQLRILYNRHLQWRFVNATAEEVMSIQKMIMEYQMVYLDDWASLERDHSISLAGAIEALKASTLRLPVSVGARADIEAVKDAVNSAIDVIQSVGSSICSLLPKVEATNSLVSELVNLAAEERAMLDECRELLALAAAMQVQQSSLRTHLLQLKQDMLR